MLPVHYENPLPIRSTGAFHLLSARSSDGRPCVVSVPGEGAESEKVAAAFAEVERIHSLIDHPMIPCVSARGVHEGTPFLEFDCEATHDANDIVRAIADSEQRIPYAAADAFIASLRVAMEAAHATLDPRTGQGICLGRLSLGNVLFGPSGRYFLIGFGRNLPLERETGALDGQAVCFQAPELGFGSAPSPSGDYVALVYFMRSLLSYVDVSGTAIGRVLRGQINPEDAELLSNLFWVEQNMVGALPAQRPSIAEAVVIADRIRAQLGTTLDLAGFTRIAAEIASTGATGSIVEGREGVDAADPPTLVLGPEAAWVVGTDGTRSRPGRALRRILIALSEKHAADPGQALSVWQLLEAGWPGEQPVAQAGANRVYVEVSRLRDIGLRDHLERFDGGYRLSPDVRVRRSEP